MIGPVCRYSLREALRNRLLALVAALLLVVFLLAEFVGAVAITEHVQVEAVTAASVLRLGAVLLVALFVVTTLLREDQEGMLEQLLALSSPRASYVVGKLAAYLVVAVAVALACGLVTLLYAPPVAVARWTLSLACELWIVAGFGLLLAITFRQPVAALAGVGSVYVLARAMGALLLIMGQPLLGGGGAGRTVVDAVLTGLAWLLPSLYRFTNAGWLAWGGGSWSEVGVVLGQTGVYLPLLAAAAAFDLHRREF